MRCLLTTLLLCSAAHGYELKRDSTGEPVAWKTALHFVLAEDLAERLDAEAAEGAVRAAVETWARALPALKLDASVGKPRGMGYDFHEPAKSTSDVVAPKEWKYNADAVATAVITLSRTTHEILEADIAFNVAHTEFGVLDAGQSTRRYDIQNAMTHELGHALGLAHNTLPATVMFPASAPGEISKRVLATDDLDGVHALYPVAALEPADAPARGCSAAGTAPVAFAALLAVVLVRRRRWVAALVAVAGSLVFAAPVLASAQSHPWRVSAVTTLPPPSGPAVLESEVTFVRDGVVRTARVAGGRWGELEQIVEGEPVPSVGDAFADGR